MFCAARRLPAAPEVVSPVQRHDLRLEMRMRNNRLWRAIFAHYTSVNAFCRAFPELEKRTSEVGLLLNFKTSPFRKDGQYRKICLDLELALGVLAEDLFPRKLYEQVLGKAERVVEVSSFAALPGTVRQQVRLLTAPDEQAPIELAMGEELRERFKELLNTLSYREREILKLRYGLDGGYEHTLEEVAHIFKVGRERVRQIEATAIRKLQQPSRSNELSSFLE